jgi:ankyrin repeat protein
MKRRLFLSHSLAGAAALGSTVLAAAQDRPAPSPRPAEPKRNPPIDVALVKEFVGAGHGNIPRVKELLAAHPRLIHATYDWGAGDFETALGGASHVGRRDATLYLLEAGARFDAFCAAMLGETGIVTALLGLSPGAANTRGPHGYSLLYHAGYSGKVAIAEAIAPHLTQRARDCNQALHPATLAGHAGFVTWLLKSGVDNPNPKNFQQKTPLDVALEQKHEDVAHVLRAHGGLMTRQAVAF